MRGRKTEAHPHDLPWFAAGKLDGAEAHQVEEHLRHCHECAEIVASLISMKQSLRAVAAEHIEVEDLVDLEAGRIHDDPVRIARLEAHLASCATCRDDLGALRGTREPWYVPSRSSQWWLMAAAAVIVFAVATPIIRNQWRIPEPTPVVLLPASRGEAVIPVLRGSGPWKIQCALPFSATSREYRIRIERDEGVLFRRIEGTYKAADDAQIRLSLDPIRDSGQYRLVLEPEEGAPGTSYSYRFRVLP